MESAGFPPCLTFGVDPTGMPVAMPAWQAKRLLHGALDIVHHLRRRPLASFHGKGRCELTAEPVGENKYRKLAAGYGRQADVDLR